MRIVLSIILMFFSLLSYAQEKTTAANSGVEMADTFRSEGKIYVVVAVVLVILLGLLTYVSLLDKKISKIEREIKSNQAK